MTCTYHQPVPERRYDMGMAVVQISGWAGDWRDRVHNTIEVPARLNTYTDGLGCPACGSFEPYEKSHA